MQRVSLVVLLVAVVAAAAFVAGRHSVAQPQPRPASHGGFAAGHAAGLEDAFSGFDGGWAYGTPYIVTLRRGPVGVTYRFARRWTMRPGAAYRVCGRLVCTGGRAAAP